MCHQTKSNQTGTTILRQSGPESKGNERVLQTHLFARS